MAILTKIKNDALAVALAWSALFLAMATMIPVLDSSLLEITLVVVATLASLAAVSRQLPLQNVLTAASCAALVGGVTHGLSANPDLAMPFGLLTFNLNLGAKLFGVVPWTLPLIWVFAILNSRGVGRIILRPWRKQKNYGYLLIALTALLALGFDLALEPFAVHAKHFWLWQPTKFPWTWQGATPLNFVGWFSVSLLILAFATPSLIKKQPGNSGGVEMISVVLWFGAMLLFTIGAGESHLWLAVILDAIIISFTAWFSWRGAQW